MASPDHTIKLHWLNGSRAQSILWLFEHLQVPYELKIYHRKPSMLAPPELEQLFPLGKSPLVTVEPATATGTSDSNAASTTSTTTTADSSNPTVFAESGFIVQYFVEHFSPATSSTSSSSSSSSSNPSTLQPKRWKEGQENKLLGETDLWRRYQHLLFYSEGSLMPWLVMLLIMNKLKGPDVPFLVRPLTGMIANKVIETVVFPNVKRNFNFLESLLDGSAPGGSGKYICGDELTAADMLLSYPLISAKDRVATLGTWDKGTPQETYPKLFEYMERLSQEPGWKKSAEKIAEIDGRPWSKI